MTPKQPLSFKILSSFISHGQLEISFQNAPVGSRPFVTKGRHKGPHICLYLPSSRVLQFLITHPEIAFPECYMDRRIILRNTSIDDFIIFLFLNKQQFAKSRIGKFIQFLQRVKGHFRGVTRRRAARANVAHHYDLTDELYALFLDDRRQYSCAYFRSETDSINLAQNQKIARLGAKLRLKKNAHILDIGCGWGELAYGLSALESGLHIHGITLSKNQLAYARETVATRPDTPSISFSYRDYRDETDLYDHIVSVGMLEHVGSQSFKTYFKKIDSCLKEDGTAVIHTIGKRNICPTTSPFITKYIFPGGYIPTMADIGSALETTQLHIADIEAMHNHYAETLLAWRKKCEAQKDKIIALYDKKFYRMWLFYLVSCEYFFRLDEGVVYQIQLIKKRDKSPSTRDYIAKNEKLYLSRLCQQTSHFGKPPD